MGTGQQNGTCPSSSHSRAHLSPAPALLSAVVDTQWGFRILHPLCAVVFSKLTCGTAVCIYPFTEDQKLVWRQLPRLAPLPL